MFPEHIEAVLSRFGVAPETKAALHQLYLSIGDSALEAFADLAAARGGHVSEIGPEFTASRVITQTYIDGQPIHTVEPGSERGKKLVRPTRSPL